MSKINKYDIEYEIERVYPYTRCDEYAHAWECHQASVYSYYSQYLKYYKNGENVSNWKKMIGIYHYPNETSPLEFAKNFDKYLFNLVMETLFAEPVTVCT